MHSEVIAQVIDECRDKADAYLRCAEVLAKLLPEPDGHPVTPEPPARQAPRPAPRVLGSQADYQAAVLAVLTHTEGGLGIAALAAQTGIKRHSVAVALRGLQDAGQIQKIGDYKTAIYRAGPRPEQVLA